MTKDISDLYTEAIVWASAKHGEQRYGDHPYEFHLRQVCAFLDHANWHGEPISPNQFIAGACHDLLEDTDVTREELAARYGETVAEIVWACTGEGANRREKQASILRKLAECPSAVAVKLADRVANMRHCVATKNWRLLVMYQKEFVLYYPIFKASNQILYKEFVHLSNYDWGDEV